MARKVHRSIRCFNANQHEYHFDIFLLKETECQFVRTIGNENSFIKTDVHLPVGCSTARNNEATVSAGSGKEIDCKNAFNFKAKIFYSDGNLSKKQGKGK